MTRTRRTLTLAILLCAGLLFGSALLGGCGRYGPPVRRTTAVPAAETASAAAEPGPETAAPEEEDDEASK